MILILFFIPLTILLLILWLITRKKIIVKILRYFWFGLIVIFCIGIIIKLLTDKKQLDKEDYYGEYIINRDYFPGRQTDWQYNNFRFEIKENDSIYFYIIDKEKILKTFRGKIKTTKSYSSERLILNMEQPTHHIIISNPTTYRSAWHFYLVFHSSKFYNVYFKKGKWKPIDK